MPYRDALSVLLSRLPVRPPRPVYKSVAGIVRQLRADIKRQRRRERNLRWYPQLGAIHAR